ncbi:hypothetical protein HELRODRAFT_172724 [Helobdella robusta]|uniref:Endonuclease/exonuclease/phosphatase domain-containing protein n=1 Tax=Helobdella robusta TaxID=6412 RepID=T1F5U9_HELRO|nr:hypothetical protein HELRODRAFT_172724 [Helobdella robusta]ESO04357.1 hypothetical protein HELRODRAFT_172724 [Helobdella robusta]
MSVIVFYAPTNEETAEIKDLFYGALRDSFRFTRPTDLIICLGNFNAVTGVDRRMPSVVDPFGNVSPNDNSDHFLEFCASAELRAIFLGDPPPSSVSVLGNDVQIVDPFHISAPKYTPCMRSLDCSIWHSGISGTTKVRLYNPYPVLAYGCEAWSTTSAHLKRLDATDHCAGPTAITSPMLSSIENHYRALKTVIDRPPPDWTRQRGSL